MTTSPLHLIDRFFLLLCVIGSLLPYYATAVIIKAQNVCCLMLPPSVRLGIGQEEDLRRDCDKVAVDVAKGYESLWERDAVESYQVATRIFQTIASCGSKKATIWFPSLSDTSVLERLTPVIAQNAAKLGGIASIQTRSWPQVPAPCIEFAWDRGGISDQEGTSVTSTEIEAAVQATKDWVESTLCRLRLCPYTASLNRAAIGLEAAKVKEGPVVVRHVLSKYSDSRSSTAAMAAAFWDGVTELAIVGEEQVATLLLVAPSCFDSDFLEFAAVCDKLIEPSVHSTGAEEIVGRAWFHPLYRAKSIGHDKIVPGHALPASLVESFMDKVDLGTAKPDSAMIALANDSVRWTPHATINLLRRSQLKASKQVEAQMPNKKPNFIYVKNVMRILDDKNKA
jgi:hypothetical protein